VKILLSLIFIFCGIILSGQSDTTVDDTRERIICCFPSTAHFNGDFQKYLRDSIHYPAAEKQKGLQGTVYISFMVEADGSITNVHAVKEVPGAPGFSSEAIRVLSNMPAWKPAKENEKAIRTEFTQPIRFTLDKTIQPAKTAKDSVLTGALRELAADTTVYAFADIMPRFPGDSMPQFIQKNIRYSCPGRCSVGCKEGTVFISFIVEKDGSVSHIKAVKEISGAPEFTAEAIRVVSLFPKLSPAIKNGKPVRCELKIPVRFHL
jgi:TonB family protein